MGLVFRREDLVGDGVKVFLLSSTGGMYSVREIHGKGFLFCAEYDVYLRMSRQSS